MITSWGAMTLGAWLWMGVWVVALLAMVWRLVRGDRAPRVEDAEAILRTRFARGEITDREYEQARRPLHSEKEAHP